MRFIKPYGLSKSPSDINEGIKKYNEYRSENGVNEGIEDLFRSTHAAIDPKDLIPLESLVGTSEFSKKEFDAAVEYLGIDPKNLYYNPKDFIAPIMYWDGPVYEPLHGGLNLDILKGIKTKERLDQKIKMSEELMKKKDYSRLFSMMDKKILIPSFIKMYGEIPDDKKYEIFKDLYVRSEYGFRAFPLEVIRDCFSKRTLSAPWKKRMEDFHSTAKLNSDGTLTIYRGENLDSSKSEEAFSWTLSKKTAKFFAERFSKGSGRILKKRVNPEDVIDFLEDRGESEVLLFPPRFGSLK